MMSNRNLPTEFFSLSTPVIADACLRVKVPLRAAPPVIRPLVRGMRVAGRVLPAHHRGSVDVFLEAMKKAFPGDVLVIDNEGRTDESCVGDLTVLEARAWSLAGLVVRGYHRDTDELVKIGFPVFSYGSCPAGPRRLDQRTSNDLSSVQWEDAAKAIWKVERRQAELIQTGKKLSVQLDFDSYLTKRDSDPSYTLRRHLRERGGAVEE